LQGFSVLDLEGGPQQTRNMAHTYIRFDFGTDEEKAQAARHKLEVWKQAFRLDKKLLYKLDRPESAAAVAGVGAKEAEQAKSAGKSKSGTKPVSTEEEKPAAAKQKVGLIVRLYFSSHEKLSEQRWLARLPTEEPFKSASPKVIGHADAEFEATDKQFEVLDRAGSKGQAAF
jgi:hypothetical protein